MEAYVRTAQMRVQARRQQLEARRLQGLALARRATTLLKGDFSATRVVVFGSVLNPRLFHERSDVDLAVWGLDERLYLRALGALLDLEPGIEVDLVEAEQAQPALRRAIEQDGQEL